MSSVTELLYCAPGTNVTLYINYIGVKRKKIHLSQLTLTREHVTNLSQSDASSGGFLEEAVDCRFAWVVMGRDFCVPCQGPYSTSVTIN